MKPLNFLKKNRSKLLPVFALGMLGSVLINTTYVQSLSQSLTKASNFQEGLHTCFARVKQSYTAKVIGDSESTYLDQGFLSSTEECFGEVVASANQLSKSLSENKKKTNTLSSDTHWFHERLNPESADFVAKTPEEVVMANLGSRFEKLERTYNEIIHTSDIYRSETTQSLNLAKALFFVLGVLTFGVFVWDFRGRRKVWKANITAEDEAEARLSSAELIVEDETIEVINRALLENGLTYCSELISRYKTLLKAVSVPAPRYHKNQSTNFSSPDNRKNEEVVEKVWQESERLEKKENISDRAVLANHSVEDNDDSLDKLNLDYTVSRVVDIFANKLFTKGIIFDMNVDEDIKVLAKQEPLEQVFFHLINNAIKACEGSHLKKITVNVKKLGGSVIVDVADSGTGFSNEFIHSHTGLSRGHDETGIGLKICQEFMKDFGGQVTFENVRNQENSIQGGRVKLLFRAATVQRMPRLVRLTKGRKSDVLRQMQTL